MDSDYKEELIRMQLKLLQEKLTRKREDIESLRDKANNTIFLEDESTTRLQHRLSKALEKQKDLQRKIEEEYTQTKLIQSQSFMSPSVSRPSSQPTEPTESNRFEKYMELMIINQTNAQNMILNQMLLKSSQPPPAPVNPPSYPYMSPYPMMPPYPYSMPYPPVQGFPVQPQPLLPQNRPSSPLRENVRLTLSPEPTKAIVKLGTPMIPKTNAGRNYPFPGNASQRRLRQIAYTALFCSLLDKRASMNKFKPDNTFIFNVKVKEVINAYHRIFLSDTGEINLLFKNNITNESSPPFIALMDTKVSSTERMAITQEVGYIIEKMSYQMSDILPATGILGTTKKGAVFDMITNGNRFPDNYFLGIDMDQIQLDSSQRTINLGDSQAFQILLNTIIIQSLVKTLLMKPRDYGVVGDCSAKVLDNIRFIATLFVYIYRRIISILRAGGPTVKAGSQVPLVAEPGEFAGFVYTDLQMDQVYRTLDKSIQYCEAVFIQWGEQYVARLRSAA